MPKKPQSYRLSEEAIALLDKLCTLHNRSQANMLEVLIKEAAAKDKVKKPR